MQWEYKLIHFRKLRFWSSNLDFDAIRDRLNECGREGWELTSFQIPGFSPLNGGVAILKKPVS